MGKSIRSNFKKALRTQRREQILNEEAHLASIASKQAAMEKCMAAPVLDTPLPTAVPRPDDEMDLDGGLNTSSTSNKKSRSKSRPKFLLPVPVNKDVQMADAEEPPNDKSKKHKRKLHQTSSKILKKRTNDQKYGMVSLQKRKPRLSKSSRKKR